MLGPATEMSAPESGRAVSFADPLSDEKWAWIVGAGLTLGSSDIEGLVGRGNMRTALIDVSVGSCGVAPTGLPDLRLHMWHVTWNVGHCLRPPGWKLDPHPKQVRLVSGSVRSKRCRRKA
jgi:hypothetical protein